MYLGTEMVDLVGGEGDRSMRGLWWRMDRVISWGDGSCGEGDGNLWDVRKSTVYDGGVAICQLTTGVACEERHGR